MTKVLLAALTLVAALLAASPARAAFSMYDGFGYTLGQTLNGQSGGSGWGVGAWATSSETATVKTTIVAGLSFSDYVVAGNAVQLYVSANPTVEFAGRLIGANQTGEIWSS